MNILMPFLVGLLAGVVAMILHWLAAGNHPQPTVSNRLEYQLPDRPSSRHSSYFA